MINSTISGDPCFEVEGVYELYLKVNVHFFVDDECEGDLAAAPYVTSDLDQKKAWIIARQMIDDANNHFITMGENPQSLNHQWHTQEHNVDDSPAHPIPLRYILKDVYVHCDADAHSTPVSASKFSSHLVDEDEILNIFVSSITTANGFAFSSVPLIVVEDFSSGLFNHEVGHILGLPHTHGNPTFCNDTWRYNWVWEPCGYASSSGNRCWHSDNIFENQNACDVNIFCEAHPCCEWIAQNNNIMTYSAWAGNPVYSALTQCQLGKSMEKLSTALCDYVEAVNPSCPPVSAITSPILENGSCNFCIDLRASMGGTAYKLDFYKLPSQNLASTGWIQGSPGKYCWNTVQHKPGSGAWLNGLQPESEYKMVLSVRNACDEVATYEREIGTPEDCFTSVDDAVVQVNVIPNPIATNLQIDYEIFNTADVLIYVLNPITGVYANGFIDEGTKNSGIHTVYFTTSTWATGHQYLIFYVNGHVSSIILIKN